MATACPTAGSKTPDFCCVHDEAIAMREEMRGRGDFLGNHRYVLSEPFHPNLMEILLHM